ncbi:hypothetical protein DPX16_16606 [Anabarilius grahami]|uniref:Uncharacterized protein n=1 Tax=Anabarilius grahami TaxID=495550 RepID=A0A3N0XVJ7_ANAGA|nr:hypothetical protein DPX16_16606 [Anabarilius grahami]
MSPPAVYGGAMHGEQGLPQGCSVDHANKSRPVTCSIAPFEGQASSVRKKKARRALFSMREQGASQCHTFRGKAAQEETHGTSRASFNAVMIRAWAAHQKKEK